ncbi:MAG: DsbA family protein [Solirubrobacterales bacterium]
MPEEPIFYYDFSSPYSYIAAHRVDEILPIRPRWQPIAFGALIMDIGKVPWSFDETPARDVRMRECETRAAAIGLPTKWPPGWPKETYSIVALRAALVAEELGKLREFSLAAFDQCLGLGEDLTDIEIVLRAADEAGVDADAIRAGVARAEIKQRLRDVTDAARDRGVHGVPTVEWKGELFWGDDRLDAAAAAIAGTVEV